MGIVNLQTNLKSLKFGRDRADGGNSGQPYTTTPIPESTQYSIADKDFILRGGLKAPTTALQDVERLTKWFFDTKNPSGLLFIAKQNSLSLTSVRTQASGIGPNEGIYNPLSTLAQAGINFVGGHFPKQGSIPGVGVRYYGPRNNNNPEALSVIEKVIGGEDGSENRLVNLNTLKILNPSNSSEKSGDIQRNNPNFLNKIFKNNQISLDPNFILSYIGGPKSILGVGRTRISFATDNLGQPLRTGINSKAYISITNWRDQGTIGLPNYNDSLQVKRTYQNLNNIPEDLTSGQPHDIIESFQKPILKEDIKSSTIMSISPSYSQKSSSPFTIDGVSDSRINQISPGQRGNIINYTEGKKRGDGTSTGPVDRINAMPIYNSKDGPNKWWANDLIQFRIASLNNVDPNIKDYIHFRAYIDNFSDKYKSKWKPINYMGRAESFYKYDSFDRDISLDFTVAAQSKEELMIQYKKLNYLASNLAPTYSSAGYMGGSLITLTVGGWLYEQPGFITGLSLSPHKESPWEIGINDKGTPDESVRELPHIITVSGFGFTPIHKFRPQKQTLKFGEDNNVSYYGKEHYIALADGNDTDGDKGYNKTK